MAHQLQIEPQGDHEYLVRIPGGSDDTTARVRATSDVLRRVSDSAADEARVVEQTVRWLLERQPVADLPQLIDLDDVAAAYDSYLKDLAHRLSERP
ncbi:hypothetical protein C7C46_07335 [Streptomyces tateyamensis]|uniref:Uncharacterized protein n=1 Tax=Streptomyces tateyamensis TaxID=565073 RepID=A0A2V4NTQ3_9ACTN|nr:hypothetical protein [Streptomyces tateyamensis]PYC84717.1 hypothetical protein C7C46_07335 [Streptomyces tateyamensis]